jgi:soluble lytic murein transglycosylase-like protein
VRKPIVIAVLSCLAIVPAAAFAAVDGSSSSEREPLLSASPLNDPIAATSARTALRAARANAKRKAEPKVTVSPHLRSIAQCESGGNPRAIGGGGLYRGKYQFNIGTWQSVGGKGDPAAASEAEQDKRAAILYARSGPGQWPVCSQ